MAKILIFFLFLFVIQTYPKVTIPLIPKEQESELALIVIDCSDYNQIYDVIDFIRLNRGNITVIVSKEILIGQVKRESFKELLVHTKIKNIYFKETLPVNIVLQEKVSQIAFDSFVLLNVNDTSIKNYNLEKELYNDIVKPENFTIDDCVKSSNQIGLNLDSLLLNKYSSLDKIFANTDYLWGTVTVSLFYVESDGTIDPNIFDWPQNHINLYYSSVLAGLNLLSTKANDYNKTLTFNLIVHFPSDTICQQGYEPGLHSDPFSEYIREILNNLGFNSGGLIPPDIVAYSSLLKTTYNTDWAYCAFVVDHLNSSYMGWAWLGLPLIHTRVDSLRLFGGADIHSQVFAHETIHDFWGLDEYYIDGNDYNYHNYIRNGNSWGINDSPVSCVMISGHNICGWTAGQIGWTGKIHNTAVLTVPEGLEFTVSQMAADWGIKSFTKSKEFAWSLGTTVDLSVDFNQTLENNVYTFNHWSDGGDSSHQATIYNDTSFIAYFSGPPATPKLKYPPDNQLEIDSTTNFEWYPAGMNIQYNLIVALDSNFNNVFLDSSGISNSQIHISDLQYESKFYWKIIASDSTGFTKSSDIWEFTTSLQKSTEINKTSLNKSVISLLLSDNGTLFAGTYENGIFTSTDNGVTWFSSSLDSLYIGDILEDSEHNIFAGTLSNGVYISTDNGMNWINKSDGFYLKRIKKLSSSINNIIYAATEEGVYKFLPSTQSWFPITEVTESSIFTAIYAWGSNHILVGEVYRVRYSNNAGVNWNWIDLPFGARVSDITLTSNGGIMLSSWYGGILLSTDYGTSWEQANSGIIDSIGRTCFYNILSDNDGNLFISNFNGSIYQSSNSGQSWDLINDPSFDKEILCLEFNTLGELLIGTSDGLYKTTDILTSVEQAPSIVSDFNLMQNYPNPFNSTTTIRYEIPRTMKVEINIYDILGRIVQKLVNEKQQPGRYEIKFDASKYSSGVYIYQIRSENFISAKKMIHLK